MGAGPRECLITVGAEPKMDMGECIDLGAHSLRMEVLMPLPDRRAHMLP